MLTKISQNIRKSRFTTCINDTGGIAVVVVTGGKFSEVSDREIGSAILVNQTANPQICGLTKFVIFADLQACVAICKFAICGPNIFCNLLIHIFLRT
jgi:hypothetical protein